MLIMNFIPQTNGATDRRRRQHHRRERADKPWLIDFIVAINSDTQPIESHQTVRRRRRRPRHRGRIPMQS